MKPRHVCMAALLLAPAGASAAAATRLADHAGVWQMRGYGTLLDISTAGVARYDLTDISCVMDDRLTIPQAAEEYDRVTRRGERIELYRTGGITRYTLDRLEALPQACRAAEGAPTADPILNFWVLWHAIRENYAFFGLRAVDWSAVYAKYRPQISSTTPEAQLFEVFRAMLEELNDMHVELEAGSRSFFTNGPVDELKAIWMAEHPGRAWEEIEADYKAAVSRFIHEDVLFGKAREGAQGTITWGWAAPGVGYINVAAMYLEPVPKPDGTPGEPLSLPAEIALVDEAMSRAIVDLRTARAVIVDARFNDGGADAFALRIMGYLTRERHVAFTKQAVHGSGRTEPQPVFIESSGRAAFLGPVFYLQSGSTISAAEIFSLAMMALPTATTIGTRTYGVLSDVLSKPLPNRWRVGMSNEIYTAVDGEVYEGRGIPIEVATPATSGMSFARRLRVDIDTALSLAAAVPGQ